MKRLALHLYVDGASRGNPGSAGAGIYITDGDGKEVRCLSKYLGHKTNNEAEYWALLLGLQEAKRLGGQFVRVFTDSELIERQVRGIYRVKDVKLKGLYQTVVQSLEGFSSFEIESIPRELNREADRLANQAIRDRRAREQEKGGDEGEEMVASHEDSVRRGREERKVRAPEGRVVRNTDCPAMAEPGRGKESATEKTPPCGIGVAATSQGKGEKAG
jgi:ribonuclease HI